MHCLALLLSCLIPAALCKSQFSAPPAPGPEGDFRDNPVYEVGQMRVLQWSTDLEETDMLMWQRWPEDEGHNAQRITRERGERFFEWEVSLDGFPNPSVTEGEDMVFFLALYKPGDTSWDAASHSFNITKPLNSTAATSTVGSPRSTPTSAADAAERTSNAAIEDEDEDDDDEGLSKAAVAGIAVEATLGGVAAVAGLGYFLWRRRQAATAASRNEHRQSRQSLSPPASHFLTVNGRPEYAKSPEGVHEAP